MLRYTCARESFILNSVREERPARGVSGERDALLARQARIFDIRDRTERRGDANEGRGKEEAVKGRYLNNAIRILLRRTR